jgi:ABC-type phosphate transport system permease subunit
MTQRASIDNDPVVDFVTFHKMVTPTIIRWVFGAGVLVIPIAMACVFCEGARANEAGDRILGGLVCGVLLLPLWRIACETAIVLFAIHDRLGEIVAELKLSRPPTLRAAPPPPPGKE